jgi:plastocyanin
MDRMRNSSFSTAALAVAWITLGAAAGPVAAVAQVSGRVVVTDAGGRTAPDLSDAVIYLEGRGPRAAAPERAEVALDARQFRPRVLVVPVGTTVQFPNQDPFNHNVFSLDQPNDFDLGLYGRNETRSRRFSRSGLVRIYCNIHPRMSAFVVVRDNGWYTQPAADGSFTIPNVPPGRYTLNVWHERAPAVRQEITVPAGGLAGVNLTMDASGYRWVQHRNKYGQEYGTGTRRERY